MPHARIYVDLIVALKVEPCTILRTYSNVQVHAFLHFLRPQDRFCASLGFHIMSERVLFYHAR